MAQTAWIDCTAGVAGDMLLGALVDAGADLAAIQQVVDAIVPGAVRLTTYPVERQGQRATKLEVEVLVPDQPHRHWRGLRDTLNQADLPERTRALALATFTRLAEAEGHVHGIAPDEVHFHEVGALDSIADVVGVCEAIRLLDIDRVVATTVAVGSGRVRVAHGLMPVPVPAVAQLALGWPTTSGEIPAATHHHDHDHPHDHHGHHHHHDQQAEPRKQIGELATPTGMALIRTLAEGWGPQPDLVTSAVGVGAGTKDTPGRPNVVRVIIGAPPALQPQTDQPPTEVVELSANVDDLDPRVWPGVLTGLLAAGALDAWLVPILMKKGRPAHLLQVLARPADAQRLTELILTSTSTFGVRQTAASRTVLDREWRSVEVFGQQVGIKIGSRDGQVVRRSAEWEDVAAAAKASGQAELTVLRAAEAAAEALGPDHA